MRSVLFALVGLGVASPTQIPFQASSSFIEPCARVSASSASYLAANPTAVAAFVDGRLFHECLRSIPSDEDAALDLLHSLKPFVELQSTLPYLAAPPADYPFPAVDIPECLQDIAANVSSGNYKSEYEFQTDLYRLFLSAQDGHFSFIPDLFGVGSFKLPNAALVSISSDGAELPQVYFRSDVLDDKCERFTLRGSPDSSEASSVISINDIPVFDYLSKRSNEFPFHDPDAAYNFLFSEIAQIAQFGAAGDDGFPNPTFYPGPETIFEFANGTMLRIPTVAEVHASFDGVTDGVSGYKKFCIREEPVQTSPPTLYPVSVTPLYPKAVVKDSEHHVAGFFLNDISGSNDTAVLTILNFDAQAHPREFQTTITIFLQECIAAGRTKLIVDLFANGGGVVELGLDTFVQLFPNLSPTSYGNMRASDVLDQLGLGMSQSGEVPVGEAYDVRSTLKSDGSSWTDWSDLYSAASSLISNYTFTNIFQANLSVSSPPMLELTPTSVSAQPVFNPENIILLTDGYCASTCAMFYELVKTHSHGRARSVVVGGRPTPGSQTMQALGTTKGRAFWSFESLVSSNASLFSDLPLRRTFVPEAAGVNGVNHVRVGHEEDVAPLPRQFGRDDADFRLFFTREMLVSKERVWAKAREAVFGKGG